MSDIRGEGHGSAHDWRHDTTEAFNGDMGSRYFCRACGTCFVHMYNWVPDIFDAMRRDGIPGQCTPRGA
jgi:hypothetical protein